MTDATVELARETGGSATEAGPGVSRADVEAVNRPAARIHYKKREPIDPKQVRGTFRRLKWAVMAVTLGIYYGAPWLRWDRGPNAPDQAILIDFPTRKFYFFFIEIWPQEVYYLTGLLIIAAFTLFLITAAAGRVWCGYTCPQTVWTDLLIAVERLIEGDRGARIRLRNGPWTLNKAVKRAVKHALWLIIAMATGGAWVFYFADAPTLSQQLITFEAPPVAMVTIAVLTFTTYTLGGLMREQVCTYMCPWPRIQGAMLDMESLVVTYRDFRGEPRGAYRKGDSWDQRGDCIDCNQCVAACPMGIDIRDGQQLECITCALCIDACNDVMSRIGRPRGLIAYDTLANQERRAAGEMPEFRMARPRTLVYAGLIIVVGVVMLTTLTTRADLHVNVLRDRNPLFVQLSDGGIRNGYTLKIINKQHQERQLQLTIEGLGAVEIGRVDGGGEAATLFTLGPDKLGSFRIFVTVPRDRLETAATDIDFILTDLAGAAETRDASVFMGPRT